MEGKYTCFDGEYISGGGSFLFRKLHELIPSEREEIFELLEKQDPIALDIFKDECAIDFYSYVDVNPPRKHTPEELKKIKEDIMYFLFDIYPLE